MNLAERRKKLRQGGLWCSLEISEIGFVAIFFTLLVMMMVHTPVCTFGGRSVDLPKSSCAKPMPSARREDAQMIAVMRDGTLYFGTDKITGDQISDRLKDGIQKGAERKVYIKADARAKYASVVEVIDAVGDAGITQIGFLMEKRDGSVP